MYNYVKLFILIFNITYLDKYVNANIDEPKRNVNSYETIVLKQNNFIAIIDEINDDYIKKIIRDLAYVTINDVYVYINSNGGSIDAGYDLINQIKYYNSIGKTFHCIAKNAFSMAFHIFQSCDHRYILPTSKLMQHQISLGIEGNLYNMMNYLDMIKEIDKQLHKSTAKKINMDFDEYINKIKTDWWIYGTDILTYKLADKFVYIGCSNELYSTIIEETVDKIIYEDNKFSKIEQIIKKDMCPL